MKKAYDALVILKPTLGDADSKALVEDFNTWINSNEGEVVETNITGITDLPETFIGYERGFYFNIVFNGTNVTLDTLKAKMSVNEAFVRHMIVRLDSIKDTKSLAEKVKG